MRGWIVLTKDSRIRYRSNEKQALLAAGVRAFAFASGNLWFRLLDTVYLDWLSTLLLLVALAAPVFASPNDDSPRNRGAISKIVRIIKHLVGVTPNDNARAPKPKPTSHVSSRPAAGRLDHSREGGVKSSAADTPLNEGEFSDE